MTSSTAQNAVDMAMSHEPKVATPMFEVTEKQTLSEKHDVARSDTTTSNHLAPPIEFEADLEGEEPTAEEMVTLRRVSGKIPWTAFTIAFVELCERFGYYGCQVLCMFSHTDIVREV
jgi:POT family proton-dependent oligopeptide transporter